jgi:hypothetical protein
LSSPFVDHTCSYIQPNNRIEVVLFVAIFSALVSTPVALLADWMINHILAAPVLEECNKSTGGGEKEEEERNLRLLAISPASVAPAAATEERESSFFPIVPFSQQQQQQRQSKRMSFAFIRQSFLQRNTTVMKSAFSKHEGIVIQEIVSLKKELIAYRNSIKDSSHQEELDCKFYMFLCFYQHLLNLLLSILSSVSDLFFSVLLRLLMLFLPLLCFFLSWIAFSTFVPIFLFPSLSCPVTPLLCLLSCTFIVLWNIDKSGQLTWSKLQHQDDGTFLDNFRTFLKNRLLKARSRGLTMESAIRNELGEIHYQIENEIMKFSLSSSERSKMKRLLFLFQKDLIPGISGEILDSKDQRDSLMIVPVSAWKKIVAWCFIGSLNLGMLFYVFLFATLQDNAHQSAWGQSFAIWLLLEIGLISSGMVVFMHIFLPALIMRDVVKIQKKLMESVTKYYEKVEEGILEEEVEEGEEDQEDEHNENSDEDSSDEDLTKEKGHLRSKGKSKSQRFTKKVVAQKKPKKVEPFNAAKYLFLSYRLAETFPELKASQIILQFSTPWPRQSYQHVNDIKQQYNDKYAALSRSVSILLIFFLTNLLSLPIALQDMIMHIVMAAVMGYTLLVHIQLYDIFPVLVVIPSVAIVSVAYGAYRWFFSKSEKNKKKVVGVTGEEGADIGLDVIPVVDHEEEEQEQQQQYDPEEEKNDHMKKSNDSSSAMNGKFATRRQSLQYGLQLTNKLTNMMSTQQEEEEYGPDEQEEKIVSEDDHGDVEVDEEEEFDYFLVFPDNTSIPIYIAPPIASTIASSSSSKHPSSISSYNIHSDFTEEREEEEDEDEAEEEESEEKQAEERQEKHDDDGDDNHDYHEDESSLNISFFDLSSTNEDEISL